ncbi:MAG: hypothetical protein K0U40_06905 [Betaproteobacteria bacterium]|nr:hypothetical protein [Betaproteobacteria bacterium]
MPNKIHFLLVTLMVMTFQVQATPVGFKDDKAGFDAAVAGLSGVSVNVLDFESVPLGVVAEGSTLGGLTLNSNLAPAGFQLGVRDIGSTSDPNSLAVTDDGGASFDIFGLGDRLDVSFAASNAFGFFLVVGDGFPFADNDVNVTFGGETISIADTDVATSFNGGFGAIWLGLVDDMATHTTASIQFGSPGSSFIGIGEFDDFTTTRAIVSVTEPTMILLLCIGLLSLIGFKRRSY